MPRSPKASGVDPGTEQIGKELSQEGHESDDSDEDEILEVSENGRWQKFNEQVCAKVNVFVYLSLVTCEFNTSVNQQCF